MTKIIPPPECYECKHFNHNFVNDVPICDAFQKGIPDKIFWGDTPHHKPYKGDHGIQFEAKK